MTRTLWIFAATAAFIVLGPTSESSAQFSTSAGQAAPPLTNQTQQVLGFYGATARATAPLSQIPARPTRRATRPAEPRFSKEKPFATDENRPAVSPFMNMFREEEVDSAPNYFAFVRPQIQQQQFVQNQRVETQHLERQIRQTSASINYSGATNGALPATGHATRFMSVGGYYATSR